ncbi:hypothetical protein [Flavobacterium macrobrachii]|uniref:hypothetical protein n=1 Tax=Flavobacterium macrobrachii TaxID=591204 RepID=UPI0037C1473C
MKIIQKLNYFIVLLFTVLIFAVIDYVNLKDYHHYDGKVIGFREVVADEKGFRNVSVRIRHSFPEIGYFNGRDSVKFDAGQRVFYSNFKVNEKVTVLENKNDKYETHILSLFYYWTSYEKTIIIFLCSGLIYGIVFLLKRT